MGVDGGNYLQHYGIERKKDENGIYESVHLLLSWNHVTSPFNFRNPRHSDHHVHKFRPYQLLRKLDHAPYSPYEFTFMMLLAYFPPLYTYVMDPRVKSL